MYRSIDQCRGTALNVRERRKGFPEARFRSMDQMEDYGCVRAVERKWGNDSPATADVFFPYAVSY